MFILSPKYLFFFVASFTPFLRCSLLQLDFQVKNVEEKRPLFTGVQLPFEIRVEDTTGLKVYQLTITLYGKISPDMSLIKQFVE